MHNQPSPDTLSRESRMVDSDLSTPSLVETHPFVVVDKPTGWATTANKAGPSIEDWLSEEEIPTQPWLVTLDRDESGLVVAASADGLEARVVFEALVTPETQIRGRISKSIKRDGERTDAVTTYLRNESFGLCSLVRLQPDLPRRHQVREHLQMIGHSIVGDRRFRGAEFIKVPRFPGRLWLHLARLEVGGEVFESPLPPALEEHLDHLRGV